MTARDLLERQIGNRLRDGIAGLKTVEVWDGAWDALASPRRKSFQAPAALISVTGFAPELRGGRRHHPRQLLAGDRPPPAPQVRLDVAVTFVSAEPSAPARAAAVIAYAEAAVRC